MRHRPNTRPDSSKPDPHPNMDSSKSKSLKTQSSSKSHSLFAIFSLCITFSVTFYMTFVLFRSPSDGRRFGIIIDGGSTGTRIHVFEYRVENGAPKYDFGAEGHASKRVNPGLSSFVGDPDSAGGSLVQLLEYGKGKVPRELWGETEVRLMATAGLRMLDGEVQERILESCRRVLGASGFMFRDDWASVITGSDEGLYAWVVANYALGTLGGDPRKTTGIIELGGASAQVTFVSRESVPPEFSRTLKYGNSTYHLYSNSLLHFGQNVAFDSLKNLLVSSGVKSARGAAKKEVTLDPCTPKGYAENARSLNIRPNSPAQKYSSAFHAAGNFSECRAAALRLLRKRNGNCSHHRCTVGSTFMPKLRGRFLATENFFYTSKFLGLDKKAALSDLMAAGERFCQEDWSNITSKRSSQHEEDILHYCFSSAYIVAFLHDSLGIPLDDRRIGYTNQVKNTPLDWALGALILQTSGVTYGENHGWIACVVKDDFPNLFLLVGAATLLAFVGWYVSQWNKPYFKTIYDLEKGRYIVTRVSR